MLQKLLIVVTGGSSDEELDWYRKIGLLGFLLEEFQDGVKEKNRFKIRLSLESLVNVAMSDANSV